MVGQNSMYVAACRAMSRIADRLAIHADSIWLDREADRVADRIHFNIKGNKFRLVVAYDFPRHSLFIKFIGTHAEYDKIDVAKVSQT